MKASELMIGNWVNFAEENVLFQIVEIDSEGLTVENKSDKTWIELETFEPIPLTEEWLAKFGFVKSEEKFNYFERVTYNNYTLEANKRIISFSIDKYKCLDCSHDHVKYVHQLQNLYFALTGEQLKL